jgi:hypothetical protein
MPIKQKMISDEKPVPTGLLSIFDLLPHQEPGIRTAVFRSVIHTHPVDGLCTGLEITLRM